MATPEYAHNDARSALGLANQQLVQHTNMLQVTVDACRLAAVICVVYSAFAAGCIVHNMHDDGTSASVRNHTRYA